MIEGGGLGVHEPERRRINHVQYSNGVVDLRVDDEAQAVAVAKRYLSYFQGPTDAPQRDRDQTALRRLIPHQPQADVQRYAR